MMKECKEACNNEDLAICIMEDLALFEEQYNQNYVPYGRAYNGKQDIIRTSDGMIDQMGSQLSALK